VRPRATTTHKDREQRLAGPRATWRQDEVCNKALNREEKRYQDSTGPWA